MSRHCKQCKSARERARNNCVIGLECRHLNYDCAIFHVSCSTFQRYAYILRRFFIIHKRKEKCRKMCRTCELKSTGLLNSTAINNGVADFIFRSRLINHFYLSHENNCCITSIVYFIALSCIRLISTAKYFVFPACASIFFLNKTSFLQEFHVVIKID